MLVDADAALVRLNVFTTLMKTRLIRMELGRSLLSAVDADVLRVVVAALSCEVVF